MILAKIEDTQIHNIDKRPEHSRRGKVLDMEDEFAIVHYERYYGITAECQTRRTPKIPVTTLYEVMQTVKLL
jgi:hypothetical protein